MSRAVVKWIVGNGEYRKNTVMNDINEENVSTSMNVHIALRLSVYVRNLCRKCLSLISNTSRYPASIIVCSYFVVG